MATKATKKLDPLISEFETEADAKAYDKWFREEVQKAMEDDSPGIPHDEVMAEMDRIIARAAAAKRTKKRA